MAPSVQKAEVSIAVSSAFAALGSLACISSLVIIVVTKSYRLYIYRLTLYLSALSLLFSIVLGLETLPVDTNKPGNETVSVKDGWEDVCSVLGFADVYLNTARALTALWMSIYVCSIAFFEKELNRPLHEVVGAAAVLTLPALFPWIPFLYHGYGLSNVWCWVQAANNNNGSTIGLELGIYEVPQLVLNVLSVIFVVTVCVKFCAGICRSNRTLQRKHLTVLKEVLPLLIYPALLATLLIVSATQSASNLFASRANLAVPTVIVCLLQAIHLSLPVSVLLHASIRRQLSSWFRLVVLSKCGRSFTESTEHLETDSLRTSDLNSDYGGLNRINRRELNHLWSQYN